MQTVAVGTLITERTGEAGQAGLVAAAGFLPIGLLSPVGGALADRVDRRRLLVLTTLGETGFASLLAAAVRQRSRQHRRGGPVRVRRGLHGRARVPLLPGDAARPRVAGGPPGRGEPQLGPVQHGPRHRAGPRRDRDRVRLVLVGVRAQRGVVRRRLAALVVVQVASPKTGAGIGLWHQIKAGARYAAQEPGCRTAILLASVMALTASPFIALIPGHRGEGVPRRCRHDVGAGHRPGHRRGGRGARPRPAGRAVRPAADAPAVPRRSAPRGARPLRHRAGARPRGRGVGARRRLLHQLPVGAQRRRAAPSPRRAARSAW